MQACSLNILSSVDGELKQFKQDGEFFISEEKTEIFYVEDDSCVGICITEDGVLIERKGAYELSLPLKENEKTLGKIGLSGLSGGVEISTKKLLCERIENGVMFSAEYALRFGSDLQRMKLRIRATKKG